MANLCFCQPKGMMHVMRFKELGRKLAKYMSQQIMKKKIGAEA